MKTTKNLLALAAAATLALAAGSVGAESQYGYASPSTAAAVTAQARVILSVAVPKMILLRVGTSSGTGDTLSWTYALNAATSPGATPSNGSNQTADWDAAAPTSALSGTAPAALAASAWTNSVGGGSLSYIATAFTSASGGTGPTLANVTVTAAGGTGLGHPGAATLAASSGASPVTFGALSVATGNWTYVLGGTPSSWNAGTYTATVTYTATSV
ncbi:MAG TPA: hypothetical protein VLJ86_03795 [Ramlibacter sp.]|nr:hypothetical protein [Ramlibacter sp.]